MTHLVESRHTSFASHSETNRSGSLCCRIPLLLALLAQAPGAGAVNYERGRELYENQCQACHSTLLHTADARKIKSLSALQQRVAAWGIHAGQDWGPDEVNDVTLYLDRTFYRFGDRVR